MNESPTETPELLRLRIHGGNRFVGAVASAAAGVAEGLDFASPDIERVRSVVDSLCHDVIESHFDDPDQADFTLIVRERHGALSIRIEDHGLPYPVDHFTLDDQSLVGRRHGEENADSLRVESRGVGGNALELTVGRSAHHESTLAAEAETETEPVADDAPIEIRALTAEDAPGLARCIYRCYGYTYANDFIYYPEQVLSLISRNLLRSYVAVTPGGEVVGHSGIVRDHPDARVAESGMAAVDPRYRSHHLLGKIKAHHSAAIEEFGLLGTYADAVAVHTITQKANVSIGAKETGLLLAEIPDFTEFRGFEEEPRQRGSVVMYYHPARGAPEREVFVPERYRTWIESIYTTLGLPRKLRPPTPGEAEGPSDVHVVVKGRRGLARIEVDRVGADLEEVVTQRFRELCLRRVDVIHVDLPLDDANAMATVDALCALGLFFGAIIPEFRNGDVLRLQYLNNVALDLDRLVLYADEAKQMLEHIVADRRA